jgi:SAM-dependent methyltransferase
MTDWTEGYIADIGYTYGYYWELNPVRVQLIFLNAGLVPPKAGTACELGFGQGMSVNIHAAASITEWHGTDFNPAQAGFAREVAEISGANVHLFDEAFDAFCTRDDLPEFDYIGLHGIWSWISDSNRLVIVDFVRRKLKVGGVLYISYNTQPGWAAMMPVRDLMALHARTMGAQGIGILSRVDNALGFVDQLLAANPIFARANPQAVERFSKIRDQNRHYVAHEYFNRESTPMSFADMADWMAPAKVQWAASANYADAVDAINLTPEQQKLLAGIPDPMFRQSVRDFCVNQQFRKDYWVKGARKLTPLEQAEGLREQRIVLVAPRIAVSLKVKGSLGEASLRENVYAPILDALADHKVKSLAQIEAALAGQSISFAQIRQAVITLIASGSVMPVQDDAEANKARKTCAALNARLLHLARSMEDLSYLASPVVGGAVHCGRMPQLFLLAMKEGHKQPADWARYAWGILAMQDQRLLKDGKALETAEENLADLTAQAEVFAAKQLPILKALQIV